jgi:hypothetical protein
MAKETLMTQSSSFSIGQISTPSVQQSPRKRRQGSDVRPYPLSGSVAVFAGQDQVRFGTSNAKSGEAGKKSAQQRVDETGETTSTAQQRQEGSSGDPKEQSDSKPKPKYGYFNNNLRAGLGFVLGDLVPIALSLPVAGGIPGFMLAVACIPLSYISGKIGRSISKNVDVENLNPLFKYAAEIKSALTAPPQEDGQAPNVVGRLNQATDKFFNTADDLFNLGTMGKGAFIANGLKSVKDWFHTKLKLSPNSKLGQFLDRFTKQRVATTVLRAEVNMRVSQAPSIGKATMAAGKGFFDWVYYAALHWVGEPLSKVNFMPIKALGEMLKHAALVKIGFDAMRGGSKT